jgi:cytochrome c oxidase subunit IV
MASDDKPESERLHASSDAPRAAASTDYGHEADGHKLTMAENNTPEGAEAEPTDSERSALHMTASPMADEPQRDGTAREHHGHDHGLAHTTPISLLFGILGALLVLTIATVAVTAIDLGAQGNLIVAMVIATIKAGLVCTFFMHLLWDKKFNTVLFLTSVLFLILFLSMTTTDRGEYQRDVDAFRAQQLAPK